MAKKIAGIYYGFLAEAGTDTLKNDKKTPFLYLTFKITHFSNETWIEQEHFNRDIKLFLSDSAWPYTEKTLESLGFNGNFEKPAFKDELYSKGTELVCSVTGDNGKSYENWDLPGGSGSRERTAPAKEQLKKFNARWNTNKSLNAPPVSNPTPDGMPPPQNNNDDIPF